MNMRELDAKQHKLQARMIEIKNDASLGEAEKLRQLQEHKAEYDAVRAKLTAEKDRLDVAKADLKDLPAGFSTRESRDNLSIELRRNDAAVNHADAVGRLDSHGTLTNVVHRSLDANVQGPWLAGKTEYGLQLDFRNLAAQLSKDPVRRRSQINAMRRVIEESMAQRLALSDFSAVSPVPLEHIGGSWPVELVHALNSFVSVWDVATVEFSERGEPEYRSFIDDTTNKARIVNPGDPINTTTDPNTNYKVIQMYKYTSDTVLIPWEVLTDTVYNMDDEIFKALGMRMGRGVGEHFSVGDGSGEPHGIYSEAVDSGVAFASGATAINYTHVARLRAALNLDYRQNAGFMCGREVEADLLLLTTDNGYPILMPGNISEGRPDRLLGYPIHINNFGPNRGTTGNKFLLFGDFSYYRIRTTPVPYLAVLRELYAGNGQVGFVLVGRYGGNLMNPSSANAVNASPVLALVQD